MLAGSTVDTVLDVDCAGELELGQHDCQGASGEPARAAELVGTGQGRSDPKTRNAKSLSSG